MGLTDFNQRDTTHSVGSAMPSRSRGVPGPLRMVLVPNPYTCGDLNTPGQAAHLLYEVMEKRGYGVNSWWSK